MPAQYMVAEAVEISAAPHTAAAKNRWIPITIVVGLGGCTGRFKFGYPFEKVSITYGEEVRCDPTEILLLQ